MLSNHEIVFGQPVEWERFIEEWAYCLADKYAFDRRVGGSRDKVRDVGPSRENGDRAR